MVEVRPRRVVRHILFHRMHDHGQTARHRAGRVNDAHPVGVGLAIQRAGVVVKAIGDELQRRALRGRIAVLDGRQISAHGELRGVAGDAQLRFRMLHGGAQSHRAAARRVGKPRVAHVDQEIHAGAHGLVGVGVRRHGIIIGVELVRRVIGGDAHVIFLAGLQRARAEFVEAGVILRRFDLINKLAIVVGNNILLPAGVLAEPEDVHIQRHVAVRDVQHKIGQPRLGPMIGEFEPLKALEHRLVSIFAGGGSVRPFVITAINGLSKLERLGGLPRVGWAQRQSTPGCRSAAWAAAGAVAGEQDAALRRSPAYALSREQTE